jgi:hypothetical protein
MRKCDAWVWMRHMRPDPPSSNLKVSEAACVVWDALGCGTCDRAIHSHPTSRSVRLHVWMGSVDAWVDVSCDCLTHSHPTSRSVEGWVCSRCRSVMHEWMRHMRPPDFSSNLKVCEACMCVDAECGCMGMDAHGDRLTHSHPTSRSRAACAGCVNAWYGCQQATV